MSQGKPGIFGGDRKVEVGRDIGDGPRLIPSQPGIAGHPLPTSRPGVVGPPGHTYIVQSQHHDVKNFAAVCIVRS